MAVASTSVAAAQLRMAREQQGLAAQRVAHPVVAPHDAGERRGAAEEMGGGARQRGVGPLARAGVPAWFTMIRASRPRSAACSLSTA